MTADRIGFEQRCGWGTPRVEGLVHCPRKRLSCTLTAIPCLRYGCGTHAFRRKLSPGECMKISLRITVTVRLIYFQRSRKMKCREYCSCNGVSTGRAAAKTEELSLSVARDATERATQSLDVWRDTRAREPLAGVAAKEQHHGDYQQ